MNALPDSLWLLLLAPFAIIVFAVMVSRRILNNKKLWDEDPNAVWKSDSRWKYMPVSSTVGKKETFGVVMVYGLVLTVGVSLRNGNIPLSLFFLLAFVAVWFSIHLWFRTFQLEFFEPARPGQVFHAELQGSLLSYLKHSVEVRLVCYRRSSGGGRGAFLYAVEAVQIKTYAVEEDKLKIAFLIPETALLTEKYAGGSVLWKVEVSGERKILPDLSFNMPMVK